MQVLLSDLLLLLLLFLVLRTVAVIVVVEVVGHHRTSLKPRTAPPRSRARVQQSRPSATNRLCHLPDPSEVLTPASPCGEDEGFLKLERRHGRHLLPFFTTRRGMPWHHLRQNLPRHLSRHTTKPSTDLHGIPWNPNPNPNPNPNLGAMNIDYPSWGLP